MKFWGLINVFGFIRIDSRWTKDDCIKKLRKSEQVVEFEVEQISPTHKKGEV